MRKISSIWMILLMLIVFGYHLHPLVVMNDIVPAFPEEERGAIESGVVQGAIHFLQARSHADLILVEVETSAKQALNFTSALEYTEKAIAELEKSVNEYDRAITIGQRAGYVNEVILEFKKFNYPAFTSEKGLNRDIMTMVTAYYSGGNVLGVYRQNVAYLGEILTTLHLIKEKLTADQSPDISLFWQLVRQFSTAALFGNYCTVTAAAILDGK